MKLDKTTSNHEISEYIFQEYIDGFNLDSSDKVVSKLPLLVENNLACKIENSEFMYKSANVYMIACKFIQKYNKTLKKYRRKLDDYEFGGENNKFASTDKTLLELSKYVLENGTYYAQLDEKTYMVLVISTGTKEDTDMVSSIVYFVGKHWEEWKEKLFSKIDEMKDIKNKQKDEKIYYTDGKPSATAIFKPFSQVIFKEKQNVLKYIDNWITNIPTYYEKYNMISRLSILLYGEPGTGKSTFAKAVANYLDIDNITAVSPDYFASENSESIRGRRRYIGGYSGFTTVYTIDDIDCICKSREEDQSKENTEVMANLLSFLDNPPTFYFKAKNGVRYPVSIVIATTNYFDKLDSAVKRYGRFDLKIEMVEFDKKEAQEMCDIYDLKLEDVIDITKYDKKNFKISPSYLQTKCLENLDKSMKTVKT